MNFVSGFKLELMHISLIGNIRSSLSPLHGFQLLVLHDFKKFGFQDFWQIPNSVLNKGISAIPPLFNGQKVLSFASDKAKLLKTFLRTLILMSRVSLYMFSPLELI